MSKPKNSLSSKKWKDLIFYCFLILLPLTQFCIFYIGVNARSLLYVFQSYDGERFVFNDFRNFFVNFENLFQLFKTDANLIPSFKNSFIVFVVCTLISVPLGLFFSNYIYKKMFGGKFFKLILFLPSIIPAVIMTLLYRSITEDVLKQIILFFNPKASYYGLLYESRYNLTALIVYSIWTGFGTNILMYVGTMTSIPESVVEAGQLDGCNALQEFWFITLPYVWPTLITFLVVSFGGIFNNQFNVLTFYGDVEAPQSVYTVGYYLFTKASGATYIDYPLYATLGVLLTLIIAPLTLLFRWALNKFGYSAN